MEDGVGKFFAISSATSNSTTGEMCFTISSIRLTAWQNNGLNIMSFVYITYTRISLLNSATLICDAAYISMLSVALGLATYVVLVAW